MTERPHTRIERHGARGELIMDRPDARNAQTLQMITELRSGLDDLVADDGIGTILLRGEGGLFCTGLDLRSLHDHAAAEITERRIALHGALIDSPKPVVAALEGTAIGGAAALAFSCDLLVAGESSAVSLPEVAYKMVAWMNLAVLGVKFGETRSLELTLTARPFTGLELLARGMATEVVPDAEVLTAARALADTLAGYHGPSVAGTKRLARAIAGTGSAEEHLRRAARLR